jgi:predicted PurR-regulated permease PerM
MAPVVDRLARHMRRGAATGLVMGASVVFLILFFAAFGSLFVEQMQQLILTVPRLIDGVLEWVNSTFSMSLTRETVLSSVNLGQEDINAAASTIGMSVLAFLGSVLGAVFGLLTFGLILFYLSADMPRLERWFASLFPARQQAVAAKVWLLTAQKTGGYVGARVILAGINAGTSAIVFAIIGLPYWLPLALWTGIVAQFVPTVGTYISIVLPVVVGLLSGDPKLGLIVLIWALVYQQVENLTIEPKISAKAVDVHPAVGFVAVLLGAALFGVAGAFLAVPVIAMLLSLLNIYGNRHEVLPHVEAVIARSEYVPSPGLLHRHRDTAAPAGLDASGTGPQAD